MIQTIRVRTKVGPDLKGESVLFDIKHMLNVNSVTKVETATVYKVDGISKKEAQLLIEKLFCEDINQANTLNQPLIHKASHIVEIAYKPGVMNPQVASIIKAANDLGIKPSFVDTSKEYGFFGKLSKEDINQIITRLSLLNPTIERLINTNPTTLIPIRIMTDEELKLLSKDNLFLNLDEMKIIQTYFRKIKRNPTDCELETIAQTWSEHCAHKTFKADLTVNGVAKVPLIQRIKKESLKHNSHIVSSFVDNSGVMDFYDGFAICGKVETHNSPSAIEPYGGAATGSGGVFRDILGTGQGAKNIVSTDMFCFAPPDMDSSKLPLGCLPPRYLLKRVVAGVRDYGNRMGIPTNNGSLHFHDDFRAKPTVIVGAYGILPKKKAQKGIVRKGDVVIAVGGRTGRDGIHGATFSSGEMTERTINVNASAVQIGNAIEEKRMFDAILEARDHDLIRAIQDCGAGGFSSAIGEMGEKTGVKVNLENAPLKYEGLLPWEIWVSESQERMVLAMSKKNVKQFMKICKKYNVEASILGQFDGSKKLKVYFYKNLVCNLDMEFLHYGLPQRHMIAHRPPLILHKKTKKKEEPDIPKTKKEWAEVVKKILAHGNICSKEPIVRIYDHSVQATNDLQPYSGELLDAPNDAVVIRPLLNKPYGMVAAHGLNPILNRIDPYWGSVWAGVEALSNYTAVGGNYKESSLINNYIWPFPDEDSLWMLNKSVEAVVDLMKAFKIPVISGKDSLSSTYRGKDGLVIKIPPVLCISVFGRIPDTTKTVTSDFKKTGSIICLVGKQDPDAMGGSIYFNTLNYSAIKQSNNETISSIPHVDLKTLPKVLNTIYQGIQADQILSCHDISEGGLLTTLFEMCVGGDMGAEINLDVKAPGRWRSNDFDSFKVNARPDYLLFNETTGCFLVETENEDVAKKIFKNIPYLIIGKTTKEKAITVSQKQKLFSSDLYDLKKSWQEPMKKLFA